MHGSEAYGWGGAGGSIIWFNPAQIAVGETVILMTPLCTPIETPATFTRGATK